MNSKSQRLIMLFTVVFGLSACSQEFDESQKHSLAPGEEIKFEIETDRPLHIGFGFELGSQSWKVAKNCPEIEGSVKDFMIKVCGGIFNLEDDKNKILAQNGGGMNFTPTNGKLQMKLVNMATTSMVFDLEIKEAKY